MRSRSIYRAAAAGLIVSAVLMACLPLLLRDASRPNLSVIGDHPPQIQKFE